MGDILEDGGNLYSKFIKWKVYWVQNKVNLFIKIFLNKICLLECNFDVLGDEGHLVSWTSYSKSACSFGNCRSMTRLRRTWRRCSKRLYGTQRREIEKETFGSSKGLFSLARTMILAHC